MAIQRITKPDEHTIIITEWSEAALCAYVAAFIDTDGSIGITSNGKKAGTYRARISLYNNNPEPLYFIQQHFGGSIHARDRHKKRFAKRICYSLVWQAKIGEKVLRRVLPYMIAKREQAELMVEFRERMRQDGYNGWASKSWQKEYHQKMKELNSRFRGGE